MTTLLTILHVLICFFLIAVVLLQSGRAGGMGVLSGAATQTVFGGRGAGGFLQKLTAVTAILFMLTCSTLAWISSSTRDRALRATPPPEPTTRATGTAPPPPAPSSATPAPSSTTEGPTPSAPTSQTPSAAPSSAAPTGQAAGSSTSQNTPAPATGGGTSTAPQPTQH